MLINGSRGSFITVPLGIGLMVTLYLISQPGRRRALAGIISTGMLLAILGAVLLISPAKYSAPVTDRLDTFQNLDRDKTFGGRIAVARKGWSMFLEAPFFGYGIGTFAKTFVEFELPEQLEGKTLGAQNRVASHNVYTTLMGETGLIGVIPFACLILLLVFQGGKATLVLARRGEVWALGVYVSFLMMSVHFWAISGLGNTSTWMIYGMVAAIIVLAKKRLPDGEAESGARSEGNRAIGRRPGAARYPSS
jgi:O-antigen ligase